MRIAVWNEGPGFPAEERPRLFRKFSRLRIPELPARKGTGMGLYTAWRIVALHGGSMDALSEHGRLGRVQPGDPPAAAGKSGGQGAGGSMMGLPTARSPLSESHPLLHYIAPTRAGARPFTPEEKAILALVNQKVAGEASLADLLQFLFDPIRRAVPLRPHRPGLPGRRRPAHRRPGQRGPLPAPAAARRLRRGPGPQLPQAGHRRQLLPHHLRPAPLPGAEPPQPLQPPAGAGGGAQLPHLPPGGGRAALRRDLPQQPGGRGPTRPTTCSCGWPSPSGWPRRWRRSGASSSCRPPTRPIRRCWPSSAMS